MNADIIAFARQHNVDPSTVEAMAYHVMGAMGVALLEEESEAAQIEMVRAGRIRTGRAGHGDLRQSQGRLGSRTGRALRSRLAVRQEGPRRAVMSAATMNEMDRLRSERDSAVEQVAYWRERAVGAEAERDALAALAVQGDPVAEVRIEKDYWNRGHFHEGWRKELKVGPSIQDLPVGTKLYAAQQPATSLARLIAEKQAEAMEGWLEQMRYMEGLNTFDCMESAELYAEELRRQAEGGE